MKRPLCAVCKRPLRSQSSIAAGVGPVCAGRRGKRKRHQVRFHDGDGANGQPMTTAEALATVRRVAGTEE